MRIRVKICGITRPQDAVDAGRAGVDALGINFYPGSKRYVDVESARQIIDAVPPFVTVVGLFVNPAAETVEDALRRTRLDVLQFHGDEDPALCAAFGRPYIKALRMAASVDVREEAERFADACALLLDAHSDTGLGGTGETFDWTRWPRTVEMPLILAGGLDASNVADAIAATKPYAVDASTGVESAPGVKDAELMQRFINEVRRADAP